MRQRERRIRRLERGVRHLRRRARLLSERLTRVYESLAQDVHVYPPRVGRRPPPQTIQFSGYYTSRLTYEDCEGSCTLQGYEYGNCSGDGYLFGTNADVAIATWWSQIRQDAWAAYNEWFSAVGSETKLSTALTVSPGVNRTDGIHYARRPPSITSPSICSDSPRVELSVHSPWRWEPYSLADYSWSSTGMLWSFWAVSRELAPALYPSWYTAHGTLDSVGWWWGWRLGTNVHIESRTRNSRWKWDDALGMYVPEVAPLRPAGDHVLFLAVYGRAWPVGPGQSLYAYGARKLVVRWSKSWMELRGDLSTWRFGNPILRANWKARAIVWTICKEASVAPCVCLVESSPCWWVDETSDQVVSFVEHLEEVPAQSSNYRELAVVITGAYIDPADNDNPPAWSRAFMESLRRDQDYLELGSIALNQWWNGKSNPAGAYGELVVTDTTKLQWTPADSSKNAIAVLVLPKVALSGYRISSNPLPSSPPADDTTESLVADMVGWCWTGRDLATWIEDGAGNPIE